MLFRRRRSSKPQTRKHYAGGYEAVFVTGVGRSGTHFIAELLRLHGMTHTFHLDDINNPAADSFWLYSQWYGLSVDPSGFIQKRKELTADASRLGKVYCEVNPYLALSIPELRDAFPKAFFVIIQRDPRQVVLSNLNKGWYRDHSSGYDCDNAKAPGYNYTFDQAHYFFGRIMPREREELDEWSALSQVGKISWMWRVVNNEIFSAAGGLGAAYFTVIHMEDFGYEAYIDLFSFLGIEGVVDENDFRSLLKRKPGRTRIAKHRGWGKREEAEFQGQIARFNPKEGL